MSERDRQAENDVHVEAILNDPRFMITSDGKLWTKVAPRGKELLGYFRPAGTVDSKGYAVYKPWINGKKVKIPVHRLSYLAFKGPLDASKVVNHKDGNRLNNHPDNLELVDWEYNRKYRAK